MVQLTCSVGSAGRSRLCSDSAGARCGRPRCPVSPSRTLARLAAGPSLGWCSGAAAAACCASAGQAPNQGPLRAAALPPAELGVRLPPASWPCRSTREVSAVLYKGLCLCRGHAAHAGSIAC